jgi:hypothetical protein
MQTTRQRLPEPFYLDVEEEIGAHPEGLREYDLINALRARGWFDFLPAPPAEPALLFRAHFLLFHVLYRLRDRLASSGQGLLQIEALCIRRLPWSAGDRALHSPDPLRAYYLDWSNLDGTTAADVNELIASFWRRFGRVDGRDQALAELGLSDPVDDETIKQTWRRLAMEHHPDRGGDTGRLQAINAAVRCLIGSR